MKAVKWSPGLLTQQPGLRPLYWDESNDRYTTNPPCLGVWQERHAAVWQLDLPPRTLEGGCVAFPRPPSMWQ